MGEGCGGLMIETAAEALPWKENIEIQGMVFVDFCKFDNLTAIGTRKVI